MPQLKKSESLLLGLFGFAVFAVINLGLYVKFAALQAGADREYQQLELKEMEVESLLAEQDLWNERTSWLELNQPAYENEGRAQTSLLDEIRGLAIKNGLTIDRQDLDDVKETAHFRQVGASVQVVGDLGQILSWLYELQQPENFRAVTYCELKPEKQDPSVVHCEARVELRYLTAEVVEGAMPAPAPVTYGEPSGGVVGGSGTIVPETVVAPVPSGTAPLMPPTGEGEGEGVEAETGMQPEPAEGEAGPLPFGQPSVAPGPIVPESGVPESSVMSAQEAVPVPSVGEGGEKEAEPEPEPEPEPEMVPAAGRAVVMPFGEPSPSVAPKPVVAPGEAAAGAPEPPVSTLPEGE